MDVQVKTEPYQITFSSVHYKLQSEYTPGLHLMHSPLLVRVKVPVVRSQANKATE